MVVKKRSSKPKSTKRTPNKSSNENAILAEIGRIVNSSELIDDVYAQVESQISKLISYDRLRVNVIDNETSLLRTVFASGLDVPQHTIGTLMPLQGTPALKALETNQVQVIQGLDEAELLDEYPNMAERYRAGLRSFMVAPLVFNGATVGSIGFFSSHSDAYSSDDASMAGRIGSQLSGAIEISKLSGERTRAEEGERRLIEQNAAVAQIGRIINSSLLIDEVYERFVDVVKGLLPFDRISITSADFSIGEARTTYVSGIEMPGRSAGEVFPVDGTPAQHVYKNGGPVAARSAGVVTSASIEALSVPQVKRGIKSFIAVPLQTRNEIVGVLQIHSVVPDIYRDWHVQLLSTIADQISGAIANSELHAEVFESRESQKRLAEDNASIAEIGRILNSTLVIEDVFELIGKQIEGLISFDRLRINLLDEKSDSMTIAYVSGVEFPNFGIENSVPMENSSSQTAMQSGQVDVIQGVDHLQLSDTNPSLIPAIKSGLRSFMFVPLVSEDKPIGTIALLSIQESAFSDRDISTAQQVASQISTAISNAQLYSQITEAGEAQRRLADEHAAVAEIGRIINSSSEISEVYPQFCEVVSKLLPCDRLSITMADLEKDEGFAAYEWGIEVKGRAPGVVFPLRGSLIGRILENPTPFCHGVTGSPKLAEQVQLTDRQKDAGVQSFIGVPMRSNNQTIGTLVIHSREANAYDERHIHLLSTIANQISGAISNSQLYARAVQSEKSLRASENELRILFESTASGILTINDRGVIESLNHAVEDIFGYTSDELVGQSVTVLMPAPFRDEHKGYLSNYLSTGKSRVIGIDRELTGLRKDGGVFPIELVVHDMEMDGQQFFTGIIRDISERVKAEEETRRLATIVESANDPIIAVDTKRRINVWNPAAEDLYGYAPEEVLGKSVDLLFPSHLVGIHYENNKAIKNSQKVVDYETQTLTKSGKIVDVISSGSPIMDHLGTVIGAVGIHRDITEKKVAERALRETEARFNAQLLEGKTRAEDLQARKTQQLQTIFEIAEILAGPMSFDRKARAVSTVIHKSLNADSVVLRMLNIEKQTLDVVATGGSRFIDLPDSLSLAEDGFSQRAFKSEKIMLIGDYSKIEDASAHAIARGLRSVCTIGLRSPNGPAGLINIASKESDHFDSERVELLEAIAGGITALFESARLTENLEQSRKESEVADEVSRILTSTLDIDSAYDDYFAEIKRLVDFDVAMVSMITADDEYLITKYRSDASKSLIGAGETYAGSGTFIGGVINRKKAISVPNLADAPDYWAADQLVQKGLMSTYVTPLIFEDRAIGGFAFFSHKKENFGAREGVILDRLASLAAPSVRNAMLYQEADRFALALDSIGESVAFLDPDLTIRYVNQAFSQTFGYDLSEITGQSVKILSSGDPVSRVQAVDILEQGNDAGWSGEVLRRTKSGELIDVLLTVAPVKSAEGQSIGRVSISRDITESKKAAALFDEQSRLAAVGELAAGVAHEINNPLTNILLCSQLMAESGITSSQSADLEIISNAARRAARIVQSLLLFARREDPQQEPMSLETVVRQALELKNYDFNINHINRILEFEEDLPNSLIDNHQISQVVINILSNAEHAMMTQDSRGEITIKTSSTTDSVLLEIRDDGPGMDPDLVRRIFEPFFTTKKPGEGTGLGLSICYGIVQQHHGEMWATSQKGVGSSFFVRLPIAEDINTNGDSVETVNDSNGTSKGNLLVVEDEPEIRQLLTKGLASDFMTIDQAENGDMALELIKSSNYDCILLDLKMPEINGIEFYEQIAQHDRRIADRIIIMTGDTASSETASFLATIDNPVMNKPFTLDEMRQNIRVVRESL